MGKGGGERVRLEEKGPQRRPQKRLDGWSEDVVEAVGGGYCRLQMRGGLPPPFPMHPWRWGGGADSEGRCEKLPEGERGGGKPQHSTGRAHDLGGGVNTTPKRSSVQQKKTHRCTFHCTFLGDTTVARCRGSIALPRVGGQPRIMRALL